MKNSITVKKYFEVIHPQYIYYKITPLKSLRNYNSDKIISTMSMLYRTISKRIERENKKYFFKVPVKMSYYIFMEKNDINTVEFFFIIPEEYETLLCNKIEDTWKGVTYERVDDIPFFSKDSYVYSLDFLKKDAFSLATDKRNNVLLSSILSTMTVLESGDKVGIFFNFIPIGQQCWKMDCVNIFKKYEEGYPVEKEYMNKWYILKLIVKVISSIIDTFTVCLGEFLGTKVQLETLKLNDGIISADSKKKKNSLVINTQIICFAEGKNSKNNAISLCESFKCLNADNELVYKKIPNKFKVTDVYVNNAPSFKATPLECQNFLSLPAKELIEEHKIDCIDVFESALPNELKYGVIDIGKNTYKGTETTGYLCNDYELRNLALCLIGANRSGKTTLILNIIYCCLKAGECCIVPDFCGNCELTEQLKKLFPNNCLVIDCADYENIQGMGYNEISVEVNDTFKQYRNAKIQSIQLLTLINSINDDDRTLKAKMDRYLEASSIVTFISNGSVKDVFSTLQNHVIRHKYIDMIPENQKENLKEYVYTLLELDERKDDKVIGTKYNNIVGIIDRLNVLKKNSYIELMLKRDCSNNINLLKEIQKSQVICIKMPEEMFSTSTEKDIYTTYWFTKIWLALQIRKNELDKKKHVKVNIFYDELYQVERCQSLISSKLSQLPKFTAKMIVSCHYLEQLTELKEELKASNSSYMILQGSNIANFNCLKSEFSNLGFSVEDLLNLKRYHSLNLLSYENGYWAGVTKLPAPKGKFVT